MPKRNKSKKKKRDQKREDKQNEEAKEEPVVQVCFLKSNLLFQEPKQEVKPLQGLKLIKNKTFHMPALMNDIYLTRDKPMIVYK